MPSRHPSQVIEEQQKVLRQVAKLARSPVALAAMVSLGQEYQSSFQASEEEPPPRGRDKREGISTAATKVILSFKTELTNADVREKLTRMGFQVSAKNPRGAINNVLRQLVKKGRLTEVKRGVGGALNVYKVTA